MPRKTSQDAQQATLLPDMVLQPYQDLEAITRAFRAPVLALDIETETRWSGTGPEKDFGLSYASDVRVIGMAWTGGQTVVVGPFTDEFKQALTERFAAQRPVIAHNAVFDMRGLSRLTGGKVPESVYCTQTLARLLHPDKSDVLGYGLLGVARALGFDTDDQQKAMKSKRAALHEQDPEQVKRYAMNDALVALQIYQAQQNLITSELYPLVEGECRAVRAYCQMAATGVRLNAPYVQERIKALSSTVQAALERLKADGLDNPNSPKARAKYIYQTKHIPLPPYEPGSPFFTAGAHKRAQAALANDQIDRYVPTLDDMSTGADVMRYYVGVADDQTEDDENDPGADQQETGKYTDQLRALADYLSASKMISTLITLLDHAALDGRIHSLVSISTHAGRRSASHPQVQNWRMAAAGNDLAGDMCGVVLGDTEDATLVEIDYSNAENWMAALLSGDDNLARACASQDFHSAMAAEYFGSEWEQAGKDRRKQLRSFGKTITFGTAYGMGPGKLALRLGIEKSEAQRILDAKDRAFPYVKQAKEAVEGKVASSGSVNLWTGRRVSVGPDQAYRGWNYCCQGGVSEMVKRAIVTITEEYARLGLSSRVALDMHDALIISVQHSEWAMALEIASDVMENVMPDEFNTRTEPAVKWIAEPDFESNERKWGKFQLHPALKSASEADVELSDQELAEWYAHFPNVCRRLEALYESMKPALENALPHRDWAEVQALGVKLLEDSVALMRWCEVKGVYR